METEIKKCKMLTRKEIIAQVIAMTKMGLLDCWDFERDNEDRIMAVFFPTERRGGLMMEFDLKNSKYRVLHLEATILRTDDVWGGWSYLINEITL